MGRSDALVTSIGLGTAQLGDLYDTLDQDRSTALVDAAWQAGIRYFDTAPHYGVGLAERRLGVALAGRPRDEYTLSSKVGRLLVPDAHGDPVRQWDFSADGVRRSIDASLTRLGLDRIDIALIHDPEDHLEQAVGEAYPALERLREEGVIRAVGVGTGNMDVLSVFADRTDVDALMVAGRLTLLDHPALAGIVPVCEERGISILNAGIFNSGLLANEHPDAASRYEYAAVPPELLARARSLASFAAAFGTTLPEAAMGFAALPSPVASLVIGADTPEQLLTNVRRAERRPDLDALWRVLQAEGLIDASVRIAYRD
ncbi:aldo/keto reductase [Plantibacter sp. Mn2098]|uniref:aldo/keto reductase n=1 Tax=Plantibacter sp. Mn2098 TaxID=3395266 RepID=UPI003BEDCB1A